MCGGDFQTIEKREILIFKRHKLGPFLDDNRAVNLQLCNVCKISRRQYSKRQVLLAALKMNGTNQNPNSNKSYWDRGRPRFSRSNYRKRGQGSFRGRQTNQIAPTVPHDVALPSPSSLNRDELFSNEHEVKSCVADFNIQGCPYVGWKYYFHDKSYVEADTIIEKLKVIEKYFGNKNEMYNMEDIEMKRSFIIDIKTLSNDKIISELWPDFLNDLRNSPEQILNCFGLAMHNLLSNEAQSKLPKTVNTVGSTVKIDSVYSVPMVFARFIGFEPVTLLKDLKANAYGKYVSVRGTVVRVSNIKPLCTKMAFQCGACHKMQVVVQPYGRYTLPTKCAVKGCRCHTFVPLHNSPLTETVDWQTIRLQESIADDKREGGRVPRTIECELMCDLVDICVPGDNVTVSGIVKVISSTDGHVKVTKDKCMFLLYIFANSVTNLKDANNSHNWNSVSPGYLELSIKDLYAVQAIQAEENLFRLFTASLCPAIYGHEMVKAGLVLSLIGGTQKYFGDHNCIPIRGDPHILIVGDPGLGKSQLLQACSSISPRGVYVCGNTTTTSGLTVTLSKEGSGGDYALEAGALVLADQGCCCIDEFDKMSSQHNALLEAMEQQTISIAKGGIVCSLPARTSVMAAANPVGGHYNKSKTVSENLKMGSALLSRFDLVFILLDKPDEELDSRLSEHVIALHSGKSDLGKATGRVPLETLYGGTSQKWNSDNLLSERLTYLPGESCDFIPHQLLRIYVAYARKYVHPKLSSEAAQILQQFYLDLRKKHQTSDSTPITTRQLESLIRLTEARARLELREVCTDQDAKDVVEIMKYSMIDTFSDEFGLLDFQRSQHGSGMSSHSKAKKFIVAMTKVSDRTSNSFFTVQQMKQITKDIGIQVANFEEFLASLNNQGFLLKKGQKLYQLQTTDF